MVRSALALLVVALVSPVLAAPYTVEVTASSLNVRATPSGTILGQVARGDRLTAQRESGSWIAIDWRGGEAWVHSAWVRRVSTPPPPPPPPPPPVGSGWAALHRGLTLDGAQVPRAGLANATLRRALGVAVEPRGAVVTEQGRSFVRGKVSWFGGPRDGGVTASETGAISGERLRSLNSPLDPPAATLAARPAAYYYAAMRFDYSPRGRTWWAAARLLVVNPRNGKAIVVRPVDWGPHTRTARVIDLSPQAMKDLGLTTDQEALVAFADPSAPLGVVR